MQNRAVRQQQLNRNLREFLSVYWDALPFARREELPRRPWVEVEPALALTLALRQHKPPDAWLDPYPVDEFNRRVYDDNRQIPLDQVLHESRDVWRKILEDTRARSEKYLFTEQAVRGVPYRFRPCNILRNESYGHYLEHLPDLRAWFEGSGEGAETRDG